MHCSLSQCQGETNGSMHADRDRVVCGLEHIRAEGAAECEESTAIGRQRETKDKRASFPASRIQSQVHSFHPRDRTIAAVRMGPPSPNRWNEGQRKQ